MERNRSGFSPGTYIQDVMKLPKFKDFGEYLFPTQWRYPRRDLTLEEAGVLLPFHNLIQTETTIEVLEALWARVNEGETVYYPLKNDIGLFHFRGKPGKPFGLISAGGGFAYVGSIHESLPHALELSRHGYHGFALQYRVGSAQWACEDLAAAIEWIFDHAELLGVDTERYSLWGGSAGARMSAYLGTYGTEAFGSKPLPNAGAVIMQYTGHSIWSKQDPPTYACVGDRDHIADWRVMERRLAMLASVGIDTEFHKYRGLTHGFGLGRGTTAEGWIEDAISFWERQMKRVR